MNKKRSTGNTGAHRLSSLSEISEDEEFDDDEEEKIPKLARKITR